jgi:hypothetical protein
VHEVGKESRKIEQDTCYGTCLQAYPTSDEFVPLLDTPEVN